MGDKVYVIDTLRGQTKLKIVTLTFNCYLDSTYKKAKLTHLVTFNGRAGSVIIRSDSVFRTIEEVNRFALVYLIRRRETGVKINSDMHTMEQYQYIENNYPELILMYMKYITHAQNGKH